MDDYNKVRPLTKKEFEGIVSTLDNKHKFTSQTMKIS
jgi:hypothetical protein